MKTPALIPGHRLVWDDEEIIKGDRFRRGTYDYPDEPVQSFWGVAGSSIGQTPSYWRRRTNDQDQWWSRLDENPAPEKEWINPWE